MPSEQFGAIDDHAPRFAPGLGRLRRLDTRREETAKSFSSIGIDSLPASNPKRAYVQVIVGDERSVEAGVEGLSVAFGSIGSEQQVSPKPVDGLPGLAMQWMGEVALGCGVDLPPARRPGDEPKSFPVHALPGYVRGIVVVPRGVGPHRDPSLLNPVVLPRPASRTTFAASSRAGGRSRRECHSSRARRRGC